VIAAALIGGLAAAAIVHTSLIITVIVAVVAGGIAVAASRSSGRPGEWADPERDAMPASRPRQAPAGAPPAPDAMPASPTVPVNPTSPSGPVRGQNETAVQLLPLPPQPGQNNARQAAAPSWWDAAQGAPPPPSSAAKRAPAPDLSTYLASTFIAQCPRCGAFRLDLRRARSGWDFRCESCEYSWTWQPGTPWPPVRVMPGRRRESRPPAP
jgi:hypothetical protein